MKQFLFLLVAFFPALLWAGGDTTYLTIEDHTTILTLPPAQPGDEQVIVFDNKSNMKSWYMTCGKWDKIELNIPGYGKVEGGWVVPIPQRVIPSMFRVWRRVDPQLLLRFVIKARKKNIVHIRYGELVDVPYHDEVQIASRTTVRDQNTTFLDTLLFGALGIMILFNLILFLFFREKAYLFYALGHLFFLFHFFAVTGYGMAWLYPHYPILNTRFTWISTNLFFMSYAGFMYYFFGVSRFGKRLLGIFAGTVGIITALLFLPINSDALFEPVYYATQGFAFLILLNIIFHHYRHHKVQIFNLLFLIGVGIFVAGGVFSALARAEVIPATDFSLALYKVGVILEALLLSIAIAHKALLERRKNEQLQRQLNQELEVLVEEKTAELTQKNQQLEQALKDKETLLTEVHHRVKNNLQLMSSLLDLQARGTKDQAARQVLVESLSRVNAMGIVHHKLYSGDSTTEVETSSYLDELVVNIANIYNKTHQVELLTQADSFSLTIKEAIPLGLVITELVTNAFKHAFQDAGGTISVSLTRRKSEVTLEVRDNGKGWDGSSGNNGSLGMMIIESLSKQLQARFKVENDQGTVATFTFSMHE